MNTNTTPTADKFMIPLRVPAEVYLAMVLKVRQVKDTRQRSYSFNQYISELVEKDLKAQGFLPLHPEG